MDTPSLVDFLFREYPGLSAGEWPQWVKAAYIYGALFSASAQITLGLILCLSRRRCDAGLDPGQVRRGRAVIAVLFFSCGIGHLLGDVLAFHVAWYNILALYWCATAALSWGAIFYFIRLRFALARILLHCH